LGTSLLSLEIGKELTYLNLYGPYSNRMEYWEHFFNSSWLHRGMVVLGGDLNFSLGASEIWGPLSQVDSLFLNFFIRNLEQVGLLDIEPTKLTPTWTNKD
jgi:hypothetical protein